LLFDYRVSVADPLVNPTQPVAEVPWRSAEMHRAPVNRNAAKSVVWSVVVRAAVAEERRRRHAGDVPALDATDKIAGPVRLPFNRHRHRGTSGADRRNGRGSWVAQYGKGGSHRRSVFGVCVGSQIGTSDHEPSPAGIGRYSVVQPHQSGI
jgi:hypothetical protein